jgi:hypothetical protein
MNKQVVYQTNTHFSQGIQSAGSFFLCMYHVSKVEKSYAELNALFESLTDSGALLDGQPENYPEILSAFDINASFTGMYSPVKDSLHPGQFAIADVGRDGTYWVCTDRNRKVSYSPVPDSPVLRTGTLRTLRVFTYNT